MLPIPCRVFWVTIYRLKITKNQNIPQIDSTIIYHQIIGTQSKMQESTNQYHLWPKPFFIISLNV